MASPKLCQIIAIEKSTKTKAADALTSVYQKMQKPVLLTGLTRNYAPKNDGAEVLPSERTIVQLNARSFIKELTGILTDLFDVTATKEWGNTHAKADIVVGNVVLAKDVPAPYLVFIEKKLVDIHTFVSKLPALDPAERWTWDTNSNAYVSEPIKSNRTQKEPRVIVKAEATDKHPAQTEVRDVDVTVGYWTTTKFSGALPASEIQEMLTRVEKLQRAVKFAREEANSSQVEQVKVGEKILNFIFG